MPLDWYLTMILGTAPPILLVFYLAANLREGGLTWLIVVVMITLAAPLWAYAAVHFLSVTQMIRAYGDAVTAMERNGAAVLKSETTEPSSAEVRTRQSLVE